MSRTRSRNKGRGQTRSQGQAKSGRPGSAGAAAYSSGSANRGAARPGTTRPAANGNGSKRAGAEAVTDEARAGVAARAAVVGGPPTWVQLTTFVLSLAGLGVSIYLTIAHYSTALTLACPNTGAINCEKVTTGPYSTVFGIPVAVLGLAFFVFMVAVNNPLAWRSPLRVVHRARVLSVIVGICFVLYLVYVEIFKKDAICLWCTGVHVVTFALFVLILFSAATWGLTERSG
jgi:uncharacterized membrane protein